jgi:hypothetical protein
MTTTYFHSFRPFPSGWARPGVVEWGIFLKSVEINEAKVCINFHLDKNVFWAGE